MAEHRPDPKHVAMTARMDGQRTVVANIGRKVKVSEMELMCLVNFAEVGLLSLFANLDGDTGDDAAKELEKHVDAIRRRFGRGEEAGLTRLTASTAAMLRGPKFCQYLAPQGGGR